jgi:hypothetical protein
MLIFLTNWALGHAARCHCYLLPDEDYHGTPKNLVNNSSSRGNNASDSED